MSHTAFLFPGQGAQVVGMGKHLCETVPSARRLFEEAAAILGYDLSEVCWNGPTSRLDSTVFSQPAIFVSSLAALESLRVSEPQTVADCYAAAGLSLGEYTALVFAGAMSFGEALRVVQRRGQAMQAAADANQGGMVSVIGLEQTQVEELCARARGTGTLQIANLLCPGNIVVSGAKDACIELERLAAGSARTIRLAVAGAFHTDLMKPADEELAKVLAGVDLRPPRLPVWSNVDAQPHNDPGEIRNLLVRQVLSPVLWEQTLHGMVASGCDRFLEIGPGRVLAGLLKRVNRKLECRNIGA